MTLTFRIEALAAAHSRKNFSCGELALDRYLQQFATQDVKRRVSNCYVAITGAGDIAGFYTFAAASLPLAEVNQEEARRLPHYARLPAGLIGRLAVDRRFKGQELGRSLIMDAATRAARAEPAIFALVVDAKNEAAVAFYERNAFRRFASTPMSLFLPVASALKALQARTSH